MVADRARGRPTSPAALAVASRAVPRWVPQRASGAGRSASPLACWVGGALGALLADHAYVAYVNYAAGTSDPLTRGFVARFTSFWSGVNEDGMAKLHCCARHRVPHQCAFVLRVFGSL